jgi:hypothetical protein
VKLEAAEDIKDIGCRMYGNMEIYYNMAQIAHFSHTHTHTDLTHSFCEVKQQLGFEFLDFLKTRIKKKS